MYDNYNYPCGADTPDSPWNQPLSELYDWAKEGDYEPDILDRDD